MLAGASLPAPTGDDCTPNGKGGCQISVPTMVYAALQLGPDYQRSRAGVSLTGGPSLVSITDDGKRMGFETRASVFVMVTNRFGLALTGHHRYVDNVRTQQLKTTGATFGIRLH
jgi:hypothetical protein